jgi:LmbE family N-acetylglucosaminyl deacetylase
VKLLVVVAHPDDESFGCGSVLAQASRAGHDTAVLCATRGEAGESRIRTDDLPAVREAELRAAARILGVGTVRLLHHADSGMTGTPTPGALATADPSVITSEVRAVIDELRPDIVVTLDASDGHRDHAVIRDASRGRRGRPRTARDVPVVPGPVVDDAVGGAHAPHRWR